MIPRKKLASLLFAVPAAFALLLAASLAQAPAASPLEPPGIGLAATTGSLLPQAGRDRWAMSESSSNEAAETRWMVAGYNGVSGTLTGRNGQPTLYMPRVDRDSTLYVQNPSENPGTLWVDFYDPDGVLVDIEAVDIPAYGSVTVDVDGLPGLPIDYEGSVDCRSDAPIQAVVDTEPDGTGALVSYNALAMGDWRVVLPAVFRELYDWNSSFWIKNVGAESAGVTLTFYGSGGSIVYTTSDTVAPSASLAYHLKDETGLPGMFRGLALIESTAPVVVAVETLNPVTGQGVASHGIPQAYGDPTALAPLQQKTAGLYQTISLITNMGGASTALITEWHAGDGSLIHTDQDDTVQPGEVVDYMLDLIPDIPEGYDGSIVADTDGQLLAGLIRWSDLTVTGDRVAESPAIGLGQAGDVAYLPRVVHGDAPGAFTEFSILNAAGEDTPVEVTIAFYDQSGALSATVTDVIPFRGVGRYGTGNVPALGDDWQGSVIVQATQPVAVEARQFVSRVVEQHVVYLPVVLRNYIAPYEALILSETFEGIFPGSWTVTGEPFRWGKRDCHPYEGAYSAWAAGDPPVLSCGSHYPDGVNTWMISPSLNLAAATGAELTFKLWLDSEYGWDYLCYMASPDNVDFDGYCVTGYSDGWIDLTLDLSGYVGQTKVWVALIFQSDDTGTYPEGAYVDNIEVRKWFGLPDLPDAAAPVTVPATLEEKPATMKGP